MNFDDISLRQRTLMIILGSLYLSLIIMLFTTIHLSKEHLKSDYYESINSISQSLNDVDFMHKDEGYIKAQLYCNKPLCLTHTDKLIKAIRLEFVRTKHDIPNYPLSNIIQLSDGSYLIIYIPDTYLQDHLDGLKTILYSLFFVLSLLFTLLIIYLINKLFAPIQCLINLCNDSSIDKNTIATCTTGGYEVKDLHKAIINLMQRNQEFHKEKVLLFKEIAHELKSPIAIIQARLSLIDDEYSKIDIQECIDETNLNILDVNNKIYELLFVEEVELQIENESPTFISMQEQCKEIQDKFKPLLKLHNLKMDAKWERDLHIQTYEKSMQKVMRAIYENIFIHAKEGTTIYMRVNVSTRTITISNTIQDNALKTHNSTFIGSKIIQRLSVKLGYNYTTIIKDKDYISTIRFI